MAMKSRRFALSVLLITCFFVVAAGLVYADDYTPPPGVPGPDEVDFGGATITFVGFRIPEDGDPNMVPMWEWGGWRSVFLERVKEAEKLFNCKITYIYGGNYSDTVMNRILSGDSVNDIIFNRTVREFGYYKLVADGMLFPTSDILPPEYFESLLNADRVAIKKTAYHGKYYGFGTVAGPIHNGMTIWAYNKTLLEREGQPDPYELWKNGEWTFDAFEKIAKAVTRDTNGDGTIDQWGIYDLFGNGTEVIRKLPINGVEISRIDENGRYVFNLDSPQAIRTLNIFKKWRNEDKFMALAGQGGDFIAGNLAFASGTIVSHRFLKQSMQDEYGFVPPPKGPDVDRPYYPVVSYRSAYLPANSSNPLGMVALVSYLVRPDDELVDEMYTALMDMSITNEQQWEVCLNAFEEFEGEGDLFESTTLWKDIVAPALQSVVTDGTKGAAAAMDEIKPQVQAWLDDLFKQ